MNKNSTLLSRPYPLDYEGIAMAVRSSELPIREALDIAVELFNLTRADYLVILKMLLGD